MRFHTYTKYSPELADAVDLQSLLDKLDPGKRTRLRRLLFESGPGNGTLLLLPIGLSRTG